MYVCCTTSCLAFSFHSYIIIIIIIFHPPSTAASPPTYLPLRTSFGLR